MRLYGAEKRQWSVGEVKADAERAGCFTRGNSGSVYSSAASMPSCGHGTEHLWKERTGVSECGLVRPEETGPSLYLLKSLRGFMQGRRVHRYHRT